MAQVNWQLKCFKDLTVNELYDLLKLRIDVFVVEQTCYYPDLDDLDRLENTWHLLGTSEGQLAGYCRILAPNTVYNEESAIGRVVIANEFRAQKLGYELMAHAHQMVDKLWPEFDCHISAQQHLKSFYQACGYQQITEMYLEDDIPHIGMRRPSSNKLAAKVSG